MANLVAYSGSLVEIALNEEDVNPYLLERKLAALKGQEATIREDVQDMLRELDRNCADLQMRIADLHQQLASLMHEGIEQQENKVENKTEDANEEDLPEEFVKETENKKPSKEASRLFKKIAKLTHPDSVGNDNKVEIFHLARKRYKENDIDGLRSILANVLRNSLASKLIDNLIEDLLTDIAVTEAAIHELKSSNEYFLWKSYLRNPKEAYASYRSFKMMQIQGLVREIERLSKTDITTPKLVINGKEYTILKLSHAKDSMCQGMASIFQFNESDAHQVVREHLLVVEEEGALDIALVDIVGETKLKSILREFNAKDNIVVLYLMKVNQ